MSNIFITFIVGQNTYATPSNDTELANATSGFDALIGGVANLDYSRVLAWVEDAGGPDGAEGLRYFNCLVEAFTYLGQECPSETDVDTMTAAIEAALEADPDITAIGQQQVHIFQTDATSLWNRDAVNGFLYPTTTTDDVAMGLPGSPTAKLFSTGEMVLGDDTLSGSEQLRVVGTSFFEGDVGVQTLTPDGLLDCTPDTIGTDAFTYPLPRVTTTQRNALAGMGAGALIYDTTVNTTYMYDGSLWLAYGAIPESNILYVGKHGLDTNDGTTLDEAFLTFGAAITKAVSLTPSSSNRVAIKCFDAGDYTENLTVPSWVGVQAESARITGNHTVTDNSLLMAFRIVTSSGTAIMKSAGTGAATVQCPRMILTSTANGLLCTSGSINYSGDSLEVEDGFGFGTTSTAKCSVAVTTITISGTGIGAGISSSGELVLACADINDNGGGTGTGIFVGSTGTVRADVARISCNEVFDIASVNATLCLICASLVGTKTNTGGTLDYVSANNGMVLSGETEWLDSGTLAPWNITARSAVPSTPQTSSVYLDDGTNWNSGSGNKGFRQWNGASWDDIGVSGGSAPTVAQTVYVAKHGLDTNGGRSIDDPLLTIGAAVTLAGTLTPSATNQISILVYTGVYDEAVTLSDDYVHLIGVGGLKGVELLKSASGIALIVTGDNVEIRNMRIATDTFGSGFNFTGCQNVKVSNCEFYIGVNDEDYLLVNSSAIVDFYSCSIEHIANARYVYYQQTGAAVRMFNCSVTGITYLTGGEYSAFDSVFVSSTGSAAETIWNTATMTSLLFVGCHIETTGSSGTAAEVVANATFMGCNLVGGSSGFDLRATSSSNPVSVSGCTMTRGMATNTRLASGVHRVADAGGFDFHQTLDNAIDSFGSNDGRILLERDVSISSTITVPANAKLVIDGGEDHREIASTAGNLFTFGAGAQVAFKDLTISDGNITVNQNATKVRFDGCRVERQIAISAGDADTEVVLIQTDLISGDTDTAAIKLDDIDPTLFIAADSYIKGNGTADAIEVGVDNPNIYLEDCRLSHGSGGENSPISNPTASTTIHTAHIRINAALAGNWADDIGTPNNVIDPDVDDYPALRSW